eukprot:scaffold13052_cov142-Skeletonema_marinoi.AAC.3
MHYYSKRGGVCMRHGAWGKAQSSHDESTAFGLSCRSAHDKTTASRSNQRTAAEYDQQEHPPQVILCQLTDH